MVVEFFTNNYLLTLKEWSYMGDDEKILYIAHDNMVIKDNKGKILDFRYFLSSATFQFKVLTFVGRFSR